MLKSVVIVLFGAIHVLSLYGVGCHFQKLDSPPRSVPWSLSLVLGLGCWIIVGGILNLFGLAYPWALNALVVAGLGLSLLVFRRPPHGEPPAEKRPWARFAAIAPSLLVIVTVCLFVSATLIPSAAFNVGDDFRRYLAYPLRMLHSGTLASGSLSSLGATTFGGQTFLQGFLLSHFPPAYINGFDLLFCFLLCTLLLLDFGVRLGTPPAYILLAVLLVVFIHPQYVNVTSLYSGSAFLLALVLFTVSRDFGATRGRRSDTFTGLAVALLYSCLILLKTTFWIFIALHFIFFIASIGVSMKNTRRTMRVASTVVLASALFISPWVLLFLPQYLTAVRTALAPAASLPTLASIYGHPIAIPQHLPQLVNILSPEPLFYGSSFAAYTFAACLAIFYGIFVCVGTKARNTVVGENRAVFAGACAAVFAAYPVYVYVAGLNLPGGGPWTWLRYFCPILIGTIPALFLLAGRYATVNDTHSECPRLTTGLLLLPALVVLWSFSSSLNDRIYQAYKYGSILAFSSVARSQDYLSRNALVLDGSARGDVERWQEMIPPKEPFVAWISTPQHLNYARNRILDVDSAGLAAAGGTFPSVLTYAEIKRYFQGLHVKYILWDHGPDAEQPADILYFAAASSAYDRRIGINSLYFRAMLEIVSRHKSDAGDRYDNVVYFDRRTVLLRLDD